MRSWATRRSPAGTHDRRQRGWLPRLAQDDPRGVARQRRSRRPLLPAGFQPASAGGTFGLIATNTIAQGDTARLACAGSAHTAARSIAPASASSGQEGSGRGERRPRRRKGDIAGPYVSMARGADDHRLPVPRWRARRPGDAAANAGKSFIGSYSLWAWASRSTTPTPGVATPIAEMQRLIAKDPRNASGSSLTSAARRSTTARRTPTTATSSTSAR